MDTNHPFVGEHSPLVNLAGDDPRGIRQTGLNFIAGKTYNGRIQLAGDLTTKVAVRIVWGTDADTGNASQTAGTMQLNPDYRQFTFSFKADKSGPAQFEVVGTGAGAFHVGAVSLMLADNLDGFRPDSIAALKSLRSGVYRFPFPTRARFRDSALAFTSFL